MSQSPQTFIHCGTSHVALAIFASPAPGQLTLEDLDSRNLEYDFSDDDGWMTATLAATQQLLKGRKQVSPIHWILPGAPILAKAMTIPHVEESKRKQTLAFEAQQNLPYSMDEIYWDSQVVADDGIETEVLFLAAKRSLVDPFCQAMEKSGIETASLGAATILDANAARFTLDLSSGPHLVVNIGARSTNLTYITEDAFTVRNIALGGNQLTQSLADHLGSSFVQAEEVKQRFFANPGAFSEDDPKVQMMQTQARQFMQRLNMEITRSILTFRKQSKAGAPVAIALAGRGAQLPGLAETLGEKMKMPVGSLPLSETVVPGPGIDIAEFEELQYQMSELTGAACHVFFPSPPVGTGAPWSGVNLLPDTIRSKQELGKKKPLFVVAALLIAIAPIFPLLHFQSIGAASDSQLRQVQSEIPSRQAIANGIMADLEVIERYREGIDRVDDLVNSRTNWLRFFEDLQASLFDARDVWLDTLEVTSTTTQVPPPADLKPQFDEYGELIPPEPTLVVTHEVSLTGAMLLRKTTDEGEVPLGDDYDEAIISRRIRSLIEQFTASEFISEAGPPTVFWTRLEDGILPFSFNLTVNPDRPL